MKPAPFSYHAPDSRQEALSLLASCDDARLLAGGQSLMPLMNLRLAAPAHLIDLNRTPGLDAIELDGDALVIGAMVRQRVAELSPRIAQLCPLLVATLHKVGVQQVRNRGTVGGSLAHLDPTAELLTAVTALDGSVTLESLRGSRRLAFGSFGLGYLTTAVEPDEMLTEVRLPLWPTGHGWAFDEVTRRGDSYAVVSAAALATLGGDGTIARISVALGGLTHMAEPLTAAQALVGCWGEAAEIDVVAAETASLAADDDASASGAYKRRLARALAGRVIRKALERAHDEDRGARRG